MSKSKSEFDDMFDQMLEAQCEQMAKDKAEAEAGKEDVEKVRENTTTMLKRFLAYIKSIRFFNKCKSMSVKHNVKYKIIKNHFIGTMLEKIADILHLTITITIEIITGVVDFIYSIINKVIYFCKDICIRLITLLTFNCGNYNVDDEITEA